MSGLTQTIIKPNFALASHPMMVKSVSLSDKETVVELAIENKSETGFFCADKNISLINSLNSKEYSLRKSSGIPICPATHKFSYVGEILTFKLFFPPIKGAAKYIDIIENCFENCFSIKGIILDNSVNENINIAYKYYNEYNLDSALQAFKTAVEKNTDYPYGWLHYNIVQVYAEKNNFVLAKQWFDKITKSDFKDKDMIISKLKATNYYKKLIEK